jgi:hypothetical protein
MAVVESVRFIHADYRVTIHRYDFYNIGQIGFFILERDLQEKDFLFHPLVASYITPTVCRGQDEQGHSLGG